MDASFPERVGRYELLMPIGVGGMATVYLARAKVVEGVWRDFALKLMHPHVRSDPEHAAQLMQEARLAARIRHAHVVQVFEVADDPMGMFLVLDYIEGDALSGLVNAARSRGEQVPPPIAGRILCDALIGLHAAHELRDDHGKPLNLVHRDFSPHNILVGTDGLSRLADFGIAKAAGEHATATGVLKGKVAYMAPEYVLGRELDRKSDIWSAGVVLWEVLCGRRLFQVKNDVAALVRLISRPPPRIEEALPSVPPAVADVVHQALDLRTSARPDALTLASRLTAAWEAYGGLAERTEVGEYVARMVAPTLQQRREEISSISARRASGSGASSSIAAEDERAAAAPVADELTGSPQVMPRPTRRVAVGAGGLAIVGAVTAVLLWSLDDATAPAGTPTRDATGPTAAAPKRSVVVRAEEPMSRLRVARREVALTQPTRELEVELLPSETGDVSIEATTPDGRVAKRTLDPSAGSLMLSFSAPEAAAPVAAEQPSPKATRSHALRTSPKPKSSAVPGLAPTPFDK